MTKDSYKTLAWCGIGIGVILLVFNIAAMREPVVLLTWISIVLVVLGIWSASRARNFKSKE